MQTQAVFGAHYVIEGLKLIGQPGLRRFVVIPLLINSVLFITFGILSIHWFNVFLAWLDSLLPHWLHWLDWLLWPLFVLTCLVVFAYCFTFIALIVASPFNGLLADKVELILTGSVSDDLSIWALLADIPRILGREAVKLLYYLPRALGLLLLFFIPLVQLIAPILWFGFNAWTMAMLYVDYPMDNHRVSFKQMCAKMRQYPMLHISFGATIVLLTLVPLLNLVIIPACVAGATKLWVEHYR